MKPLVETADGGRHARPIRRSGAASIVESDGRVVGVRARQYGSEMTIRARRGVVLATGSFAYNDAMVAQYAPRIAGRPAASIEQHDGQAIRMAQALGADLAHMDATEVAIFIDPQQLVRGILVNGRGQRYVAEDTYPGRVGQLTLYHQDNTAYLIIDSDAQDEAMNSWSPKLMLDRRRGWPTPWPTWNATSVWRPVHCRRRWPPTTTAPRAARTHCCTRSPSGSDRSGRRSERSTCARTPAGSPSAACDLAGRRGVACQRRADPRALRRGQVHRRIGGLGLRQRRLAG